jgi:hypothetical protein
MGSACCGDIIINPTDVIDKGKGYYDLKLKDGSVLQFNLHNNIAEKARALLEKAWDAADCAEGHRSIERMLQKGLEAMERNSRPGANAGDWAEDAKKLSNTTSAPASPAPPASPPPREVEVNALSGAFDNVSNKEVNKTRRNQRNQKKKDDRLAQLETERLAEAERQAAQAREEAFRAESIRLALEAQKLADKKRREMEALKALGEEYDKLDSFVKQHLGITEEQFLADPEECRAKIHVLKNSAVQEPVPEEGGSEEGPILPPVFIKTPDPDVVGNIVNIGQEHGVQVTVTTRSDTKHGKMHVIGVSDLILRGVLNFALSRKGNEMMCGLGSDNGTLVWGHYAFVCSQCYDALVSIRPDLADMVRQVMVKRVQMKHQPSKGFSAGQGILPTPLPQYGPVYVPYIPVYNMWGQVVEWQVVPGA